MQTGHVTQAYLSNMLMNPFESTPLVKEANIEVSVTADLPTGEKTE